jgi:fumarate reductase subunit C
MIRELSSVFIAIFLIVFLVQIYQLTHGQQAYTAFIQRLGSPGWITFHVVALLFALYHTFTWFQSSSVVLQIKIGRQELPRPAIMGLHIGAWIVASAVILVLFILLRS